MIWAILALLGIPLWFCAIAIGTVVFRNRKLRKRPGNAPVRVLIPGKTRWSAGHGVWVSDVFAWRGSPAAWDEDLLQVRDVIPRGADPQERKKLRRLGEHPAIATLALSDGETLDVAAGSEQRAALLGPFAAPEQVPPARR